MYKKRLWIDSLAREYPIRPVPTRVWARTTRYKSDVIHAIFQNSLSLHFINKATCQTNPYKPTHTKQKEKEFVGAVKQVSPNNKNKKYKWANGAGVGNNKGRTKVEPLWRLAARWRGEATCGP